MCIRKKNGSMRYGTCRYSKRTDAFPGQDVVLVKYTPDFDPDREWVYNGADIDGQKIVWARDMGPERIRSYGLLSRAKVLDRRGRWRSDVEAIRREPVGAVRHDFRGANNENAAELVLSALAVWIVSRVVPGIYVSGPARH